MASGPLKMFSLKHKWQPERRKHLFQSISGIQNVENIYFASINGIQNIENDYFKAQMESGQQKMYISNHKWHLEHKN